MPSISYEFNQFEFTRKNIDPVSKAEYELIRKDYDDFIDDYIDAAKEAYSKMPNPNAFKWKYFFILLSTALILTGMNLGLKALDYYDAGEVFAMISFIPYFAIAIQPFQWVMGEAKNASVIRNFGTDAKIYFSLHRDIINVTKDYNDYLLGVKRYYNKEGIN